MLLLLLLLPYPQSPGTSRPSSPSILCSTGAEALWPLLPLLPLLLKPTVAAVAAAGVAAADGRSLQVQHPGCFLQ
jgi:hypothetical protein